MSVLFSVSACNSAKLAPAPDAHVEAPVAMKTDVPVEAPPVVAVKVDKVEVVQPAVQKPIVVPPPVAEIKVIEHPKTAADFMANARAYVDAGERGKAIAAANKAVKLAPESSSAWNTLGRAELLRKSYDDALTAFGKAVELDPGNAWAWNNLGFTKLELGKYADAIEPLEKATALPAATGYMFNNLGTAYEHEDRLDEARDAFAKGGTLGSTMAMASRKRLEGVATLAVKEPKKVAVKEAKVTEPEVQETVPAPKEEPHDVADAPADAPAADVGSGAGSDVPATKTL